MKEFSKKDLRTGMIVVTKAKGNFMILGQELRNEEEINDKYCCVSLEMYEENLMMKDIEQHQYDIVKVYEIIAYPAYYGLNIRGSIKGIEDLCCGKLIWEEKNPRLRIDWSKVPKWTKVLAEINTGILSKEFVKAYFLNYSLENNTGLFLVTTNDEFTYCQGEDKVSRYIKIYDEKDIKDEWYFKEDGENANE